GLQRTTFGFLVVDDDCNPHVELLADLHDVGGEGDGMCAVVSLLAGYLRCNDPVQGFGAEHVTWNDHRHPSPGGETRPALVRVVHASCSACAASTSGHGASVGRTKRYDLLWSAHA